MDLTEALLHRYTSSVVSILNAGPTDPASDPSVALRSLKDLLPALAALAPAGASRLIDALVTWYNQHRRGLQENTGSTWPARVLELAFWHAAHVVLAPLPPRALGTREVQRVAESAFEAILNTTTPAPHWERWALPGFENDLPEQKPHGSGSDLEFTNARDFGGASGSGCDDRDRARGGASANRDTDEYAYSYSRGAACARNPAAPAPLCPSPPASDLAARCLGLASRHDPAAAAEKFARELAPRTEGEGRRPEAHAVIYGARYLRAREVSSSVAGKRSQLELSGAVDPAASEEESALASETAGAALHAAATTIRLLNPVSWAPSHRKSDLRHALCALLRGALAGSAGARLPDEAPDDARAAWADAVSECREDVTAWIKSKEKKHAAAGLPLLGALHAAEALCGSGTGGTGLHDFLDTTLSKALREGKHRAPAVDALRAVIEGIAPPLPANGGPAQITRPLPEETRARLRAALASAAAAVKRTSHSSPTDPPLVTAVARALAATARVDPLLAADVALDLLREAKVSDALAAGLAALPDIFALTSAVDTTMAGNDYSVNTMEGLLREMRDSGADATAGWSERILASCPAHGEGGSHASGTATILAAASAAETASSLARELRKRLSGAARALQHAKPTEDGAVAVAVALLRCAPFVTPEEWRGVASGEAVPPLVAHPHPAVRRAAAHAVRRIVTAVPAARDAVVQGVAAVMLRAPSASPTAAPGVPLEDADVAAGAAGALRDACLAWRLCLESDTARVDSAPPSTANFDALRPESAGLLLLCSPSARTRGVAAETLREVAALASATRRGETGVSGSVSLFSIIESCAGEMLLCALDGCEGFEEGSGLSLEAASAAVATAGGAAAVARHVNGAAWTSALGVLAARAATAAPEAATTARAQALQRVQLSMLQEGARVKANVPRAPTDPNGEPFELWRNLACFVCAASPKGDAEISRVAGDEQNKNDEQHVGGVPDNPLLLPHGRLAGTRATPLGARGSQASMFALLVPCLREGGAQAAAAAAVLARVPPLAAPRLLAALAPLQAELAGGGAAGGGGTPFDRRSADRELRAHLARLFLRLAACGAVEAAASAASSITTTHYPNAASPNAGSDGDRSSVSRSAVAARLVAFVDATLEYTRSTAAQVECGPDELARLQFAAAATTTACAPAIAAAAPHVLDRETRARWWERFAALEQRATTQSGGESSVSFSGGSIGGGVSGLNNGSGSGSVSGYDLHDPGSVSGSKNDGFFRGTAGAGSARSVGSFDSERDGSVRASKLFRQDSTSTLDARLVQNTPYARWGGSGSVDKRRLGLNGNGFGGAKTTKSFSNAAYDPRDARSILSGGSDGQPSETNVKHLTRNGGSGVFCGSHHHDDPAKPQSTLRASREAMAALLIGPAFDDDQSARSPTGRVMVWIDTRLEREKHTTNTKTATTALHNYLTSNPHLAHVALNGCYSASHSVARAHVAALSDLYVRFANQTYHATNAKQPSKNAKHQTTFGNDPDPIQKPTCSPAKLLALVLSKLVSPSSQTREDAVALLRAVAATELGEPDGNGYPRNLPDLPDAYRAFQLDASAELAKRRPDIGEELLVEALERLIDDGTSSDNANRNVSDAAQRGHTGGDAAQGTHKRVLQALAPWIQNVHLPHIAAAGRAERLLRALYFVTYKHCDAMPEEVETLWAGIGKSPRNVVPALRFLETKGLEDVHGKQAMALFCVVAKRACLFLARAAPRQSVDQLVYAVSLRGLEMEYPPSVRRDARDGVGFHQRNDSDGTSVRSGVSGFGRTGASSVSRSNYSFDGRESESDDDENLVGKQGGDTRLRISAPDLAVILLAEVAAEHGNAFRVHLPVLLHAVTATLAGSPEHTVRAHCQQLLLNLTHALAAKPLESARNASSGTFPVSEQQRVLNAQNGFVTSGTPSIGSGWKGEVSTWGGAGTPNTVASPGAPSSVLSRRGENADGDAETVSSKNARSGRLATGELQVCLARQDVGGHDSGVWSPEQIARLVGLLPDALVFEPGLRKQWADEARRWLLRAASFPLAAASARVLAALKVPLDPDAADALLSATCASAAAAEGGTVAFGLGSAFGGGFGTSQRNKATPNTKTVTSQISARSAALAGTLTGLLLDTLTEMFKLVDDERVVVDNAHVFWGAAACLRTMHAPTYGRAARLVAAIAQAWPLDDPSGAAVEILRAAAPVEVGTPLSAIAPNAIFTDPKDKRWRGAKTMASACAAAAAEAWLCGVGTPDKFAEIWTLPLPPLVPPPAMSLHDIVPLLVKGLARPQCAAHSTRALASLVPVVGIGDTWGGERALALCVAGLLPAVLAAAAAAEELEGDALMTPRTPSTPTHNSHQTSRAFQSTPNALSVGEGAAAGRWLAAGLRAASAASLHEYGTPRKQQRGASAADALATAIESVLPSPSVSFAAPRGRRTCSLPPAPVNPNVPPPSPSGSSMGTNSGLSAHVARVAQAVAPSLFLFLAPPAHAGAVAKVLVDIAVASRHTNRERDTEDTFGGAAAREASASAAAAALELLIEIVARARVDVGTKNALLRASGGGSTSAFAPIASLLDGPLSHSALELLRRVAELGEGSDSRGEASADEAEMAKWGRVSSLGSPSAMWNSVDANGGRAVDLMYGVMLSGRLDPTNATLPACLVGDSAER